MSEATSAENGGGDGDGDARAGDDEATRGDAAVPRMGGDGRHPGP